jgi:hypothetical protein
MRKTQDQVAAAHSELAGAVFTAHPTIPAKEQNRLIAAFEGFAKAVAAEAVAVAITEHERRRHSK